MQNLSLRSVSSYNTVFKITDSVYKIISILRNVIIHE
uniref:Uncharacterized protein n=1 Tax=Arundo donax TaxID=35708 RepID=A0A0A9CMJ0_ARUDO